MGNAGKEKEKENHLQLPSHEFTIVRAHAFQPFSVYWHLGLFCELFKPGTARADCLGLDAFVPLRKKWSSGVSGSARLLSPMLTSVALQSSIGRPQSCWGSQRCPGQAPQRETCTALPSWWGSLSTTRTTGLLTTTTRHHVVKLGESPWQELVIWARF